MRRRGIVSVLAVVLALVGTGLILSYVQGADARALGNQQPVSVVVITKDVPKGTTVKELGGYTQVRSLPKVARAEGAVASLTELKNPNHVVSATLKQGEQLLASRLVQPESDEITAQFPLPPGMQELSIQLEPQRVVGSDLTAGDKVGVYLSMKVKDASDKEASVTDVIAHKVRVLRAQGAVPQSAAESSDKDAEKVPSTEVIVTLAVSPSLAERIIFGQEFGKIWLTQERDDSATDGTRTVHAGNVYQP